MPSLTPTTSQNYKESDHVTRLCRAIAWFRDDAWPRSGLLLDNFLEIGPFQRHDVSTHTRTSTLIPYADGHEGQPPLP